MLVIIAAALALAAYLFYEYRFRKEFFSLRERLGLAGPKADLISGNVSYFMEYHNKHGIAASPQMAIDLRKEYGDIFGFYVGTTLDVVITDPALIREAFITKFSSLPNRKYFTISGMYPFGDGLLQVGVEGGSHGVGWKEIRSVVSAIFTSGKMKKMHHLFHDQVDTFVDCLREKSKEEDGRVEIYGEYQALTMDMIARCAFGMHNVSCIRDRDNTFYKRARFFFANFNVQKSPLFVLSMIIPPLGVFRRFSAWGREERKIVDDLSMVVAQRQKDRLEGKTREIPDLIDLILQENDKRAENGEKPMHQDVIVSNCWAFMLAGYETTSTALTYATWLLAANPECQERLYEEVVETFGDDGDIDYDRVMRAPYLNAVVMETLRLKAPVVLFTARECINDTTLGDTKIPKGVTVATPVHAMHLNEEYFPDPLKFLPDRFINEKISSYNNNYTYMPFGIGPRNCVGARFAEMEFKTVLASVVRKFRFEVDLVEPELKTFISTVLQLPLNNRLYVRVIAR